MEVRKINSALIKLRIAFVWDLIGIIIIAAFIYVFSNYVSALRSNDNVSVQEQVGKASDYISSVFILVAVLVIYLFINLILSIIIIVDASRLESKTAMTLLLIGIFLGMLFSFIGQVISYREFKMLRHMAQQKEPEQVKQ